MRSRYKIALLLAGFVLLVGCAVVGLQHMMPIEKERAQKQKQRATDIVQMADSLLDGGEGAPSVPSDIVPIVATIRDTAQDMEKGAVRSERWSTAGEKIVGPPPPGNIRADTDEELAILAQTEQEAETMGKVRGGLDAGRRAIAAAGGGGLSSWLTGTGLVTVLGAVGAVAEVGRRKFKKRDQEHQREREADRLERERLQRERDEQQDLKLQMLTTQLNDRMQKLEDLIEGMNDGTLNPPTGRIGG